MKVLVACEESQAVTIELRKLGHEAYSCDLEECSGGHPEWHILQDVIVLLSGFTSFDTQNNKRHTINSKWDMIIAFPPCTDLCVSGARHFGKKRADGRQRNSIEFFMKFVNADCDKVAIENPIGIISGDYTSIHFFDLKEKYNMPLKPTQIIQPYYFGDPYKKTTCIWLKGLEPLKPTNTVEVCDMTDYICKNGKNAKQSRILVKGGKERQKNRSKTFPGIAKAMAEQWSK